MKGLELSERYFEEFGLPLLTESFAEFSESFAAGLCGGGSECYGFDDEISRDHDFAPCFCLFVPDDTDERLIFRLERAYAALPREYLGVGAGAVSGMAANRRGVIKFSDFFSRYTGCPGAPESWQGWLYTPESGFAEAVNGEIFYDPSGRFTEIRNSIETGMPEDVWLKKLAARAAAMAQSGQYNFSRCIDHGEKGAAVLALSEFVRASASMIFLLNRKYCPYYKWSLRALGSLPLLGDMSDVLEFLLVSDNTEKNISTKKQLIEDISALVISAIKKENLSDSDSDYLEAHAIEITKRIRSIELRSLHLMIG